MTLEDYIEEQERNRRDVRKKTLEKYQTETQMLQGLMDNWFKLIPRENMFDEAVDSLSGIMLLNSWRLSRTITCEILSGEYFEAIRNLRFIFEGTAHAFLLEEVIASLTREEQETLTPLPVKAIMLQAWEECKRKKVTEGNSEGKGIEAIVLEALSNRTSLVKINEAPNLIHPLTRLPADKRIYTPTTRILELTGDTLQLPNEDIQSLKQLWRDLSDYQHFSHPYIETIIRHPELCFKEKLARRTLQTQLQLLHESHGLPLRHPSMEIQRPENKDQGNLRQLAETIQDTTQPNVSNPKKRSCY